MRLIVVVGVVLVVTIGDHGARAQTAGQKPLTFAVVSIKPTPPAGQDLIVSGLCREGGRFFVKGSPLLWILAYAYQLKEYQIVGAPTWMKQIGAYEVEAKPPAPVNEAACRSMVQSLFVERFNLRTHRESRTSRVYLMTIGKNGAKLREGGELQLNGGIGLYDSGKPVGRDAVTMSELAGILSHFTDRPVVDRTGLAGRYGMSLNFAVRERENGLSVFTAVQEQLGLKLEAGKAPIELVVIDHIEKPTPN